ncbi:MAG: GWxTD domain-containing protein [Crocinitomicaceae bacterium]
MYKLLFLSLFLFVCPPLFAQKKKLKAYLDLKEFYNPETGSYIEVQLQFSGISTELKTIGDSALQSELAMYFEIYEQDSMIRSSAYILKSPQFLLRDSIVEDFYEINRFALDKGDYKLKLEIQDLGGDAKNKINGEQLFTIHDPKKQAALSDITIAEYAIPSTSGGQFQKSGYQIIPMLSSFFPSEITKMPFYYESYNTNTLQQDSITIRHEIIDVANGTAIERFTNVFSHESSPIKAHLSIIDIETLETGRYLLKATILDQETNAISSCTYGFDRSNEVASSLVSTEIVLDPAFQSSIPDDLIDFYLESLIPIARPAEVKNIISTLKTKNLSRCRRHIQAFWLKSSPVDSYESWIRYKTQVDFVEKVYANNFQDGFQTDRGRVYLQYGSPSSLINKETSPSEYPYEIWTYNKIGVFSNRRFVFYNPDLVNRAYRLLHSDMVGELKNPSWPQVLSKRNTVNGNVDNPNQNNIDHWGGNSNEYYRQY